MVVTYSGDNLTAEQRSRTMRAVKRKDTSSEIALRRALRKLGLSGYKVDAANLPGRPDLAFTRQRLAVFVDGGFWHGRADRVRPGRHEYWDQKIERNRQRDRAVDFELQELGWDVLRLWDDEVNRNPSAAALRVYCRLTRMPAAEFFAGIGLVRMALDDAGFDVVYANDIDPVKKQIYARNFGVDEFHLKDIRRVRGNDIPTIALATASFPCTDLSLAGNRRGLAGEQSGMFWEFARILAEMGDRKPRVVVLENVPGFATSRNGADLCDSVSKLNKLGYTCDLLELNARRWVPQSRERFFVIGSLEELPDSADWTATNLRSSRIANFVKSHPDLDLHALELELPSPSKVRLRHVVEQLDRGDERWWPADRVARFVESLAPQQFARLQSMKNSPAKEWRTAYRRTRQGKPVWEIRADEIAGCLRTARGGSSRQALVEAGEGSLQIRWMTPREYAALMGAPNLQLDGVSENQALFGLGDAVCVPTVAWLLREYVSPLLRQQFVPAL